MEIAAFIFGAIFGGPLIAAAIGVVQINRKPKPKKPDPLDEAVNAAWEVIVTSLMTQPEDWSFGEYTTENKKRKVSIWTANGPRSLTVAIGSGRASPASSGGEGIQPPSDWANRIDKAIKASKATTFVAAFRDTPIGENVVKFDRGRG